MPSAKTVSPIGENNSIMIIGAYGTGKSIFAASCPTPGFVFDFDSGIETYAGLNFDFEQYETTFQGWMKFEKDLTKHKKDMAEGKYKTTIVDSTTLMTDLAMERAMQLNQKRSEVNGPIWNIHYGLVKNLISGRIRQICNLPGLKIVIAHKEIVIDSDGQVLDIQPLLTGQLSETLPGAFTEVYYATTKRKEGKTTYWLQTVPVGFTKARSRWSGKKKRLKDYIPNDYKSLTTTLNTAIQKEKKANGKKD